MSERPSRQALLAVLVAALGYFVDIYDLILFSIVRVKSLESIGVPAAELLEKGVLLINLQMAGMLVGGLFWGILGDRRGRLSVLFGSIALYSLANLANGFVQDVPTYAALRFVAGLGLAGELGAGITLVSESLGRHNRGKGTTLVAGVGITGAVFAALVGAHFGWRTAYFVGGGLGLALLLLRVGVAESSLFSRAHTQATSRGNFWSLLNTPVRAKKYLSIILVGVPIWFTVGVLVTFSPELGRALGLSPAPDPGRAVLFNYAGLALGDFASGALSQALRSRKKVLGLFLGFTALAWGAYFAVGGASLTGFYAVCFVMGLGNGYWAMFVTVASEQFGTNVRATATTTVPNFVRGAVVPLTMAFGALKGSVGVLQAAALVGAVTWAVALLAITGLEETFGKDLDHLEGASGVDLPHADTRAS
jgi:predicted MFS family arabinose efflux permease